ncbi:MULTISPECIES: TetR/AcrR family transcriptional regulator [Vibrio]|nr:MULTISPECIES: TetR/AcrR family transcriptional regulator [Vibrio]NAW56228.1 TetR family transcriptional regulator [Vibrio sp. V36_P2S2PM302]NAX21880.1 TetR family transcriptional regulator [Vibrio sp. V39_P1S14PM300]NAX25502.1 TetR family transcriptional regulator [Vibrio sp. V38_P2S17PM301]NAX29883.1 TetR family transcriptional regulator [Vibrio sp. V37_P2S8PM304]
MDKRTRRGEKTKANIIAAAIECYKQQGVQGASLCSIAKQANTTKPTVYAHFGSKENLYRSVVHHVLHEKSDEPLPAFNPQREIRAQLIELFDFQLERVLSCEKRRLLVAITIESMCQGTCHLNDVGEIKVCPLENWLSEAMDYGALTRQDPHELAINLWALVKGRTFFPIFLGMASNEQEDRRKSLESAIDFFLLNNGNAAHTLQ